MPKSAYAFGSDVTRMPLAKANGRRVTERSTRTWPAGRALHGAGCLPRGSFPDGQGNSLDRRPSLPGLSHVEGAPRHTRQHHPAVSIMRPPLLERVSSRPFYCYAPGLWRRTHPRPSGVLRLRRPIVRQFDCFLAVRAFLSAHSAAPAGPARRHNFACGRIDDISVLGKIPDGRPMARAHPLHRRLPASDRGPAHPLLSSRSHGIKLARGTIASTIALDEAGLYCVSRHSRPCIAGESGKIERPSRTRCWGVPWAGH